jgi:hypothetical protein
MAQSKIYTYIPTGTSRSLSKCISLTATRGSGKNNTLAQEDAEREKFERSSYFALDKKKAGRWAAHAKKADSLQLETYQYCIWKRVHARLDTRDETARAT